jgi:excinuclease UvrABC ATPase subunit
VTNHIIVKHIVVRDVDFIIEMGEKGGAQGVALRVTPN